MHTKYTVTYYNYVRKYLGQKAWLTKRKLVMFVHIWLNYNIPISTITPFLHIFLTLIEIITDLLGSTAIMNLCSKSMSLYAWSDSLQGCLAWLIRDCCFYTVHWLLQLELAWEQKVVFCQMKFYYLV